MRNSKLISLMLLLAAGMLSIQCTTDPIPGPPGEDGIDGIDGAKGTAECAVCHNVEKSEAVHASYLFSGHAEGGATGYAGGRDRCAKCHSNEGFIDYVTTGAATNYENPTNISCTTCHEMHTSFDFETDGFDYALRIVSPVTLTEDPTYTIDYGKDAQTSHICATCHQPRDTFEANIQEDGTVDVGSRFGPHYGAQSVLLEGIQGAELDGYEYPDAKSAGHRTGSSCNSCHMGEPTDPVVDGNHTWVPTTTSCTVCHTNGVPSEVSGYEEAYKTLEDLLLAEGLLYVDDEGGIRPQAGIYDLIPAAALWNYRMLYYDHSHRVHNPVYARALIQNSIDALNAN
jgi:hypothetical protein